MSVRKRVTLRQSDGFVLLSNGHEGPGASGEGLLYIEIIVLYCFLNEHGGSRGVQRMFTTDQNVSLVLFLK